MCLEDTRTPSSCVNKDVAELASSATLPKPRGLSGKKIVPFHSSLIHPQSPMVQVKFCVSCSHQKLHHTL